VYDFTICLVSSSVKQFKYCNLIGVSITCMLNVVTEYMSNKWWMCSICCNRNPVLFSYMY